jgi:hypothetical protein
MSVIKKWMTVNFRLLNKSLTLTQAITEMSGATYGVIQDEQELIALVLAEDLNQAASRGISSLLDVLSGIPPSVIVGCEIEMQQLVNSPAMTFFDVGTKGAIVVGNDGVVGVLPVEVVDDYVNSDEYQPPVEVLGDSHSGDSMLGGYFQTPSGIAICAAPGCGYPNKLADFDPDYPPNCQNPSLPQHQLQSP